MLFSAGTTRQSLLAVLQTTAASSARSPLQKFESPSLLETLTAYSVTEYHFREKNPFSRPDYTMVRCTESSDILFTIESNGRHNRHRC